MYGGCTHPPFSIPRERKRWVSTPTLHRIPRSRAVVRMGLSYQIVKQRTESRSEESMNFAKGKEDVAGTKSKQNNHRKNRDRTALRSAIEALEERCLFSVGAQYT